MSYNDFVNDVRKILTKSYKYTDDEANKALKDASIQKVLRTNYNAYNEKKYAGSSPTATASCVDMMN